MLDEQQQQAASDLLYRHWREGRRLPALPEPLRPATRAEGYAIQALLEPRSARPLASAPRPIVHEPANDFLEMLLNAGG